MAEVYRRSEKNHEGRSETIPYWERIDPLCLTVAGGFEVEVYDDTEEAGVIRTQFKQRTRGPSGARPRVKVVTLRGSLSDLDDLIGGLTAIRDQL